MQIISTNIGEAVTIKWRGQQIQTGIFKYGIEAPIFLGKEDVLNDQVIDRRYHGGADKACYLYSADHYSYWQNKYPKQDWQWGMFGENLTVRGLNESEMHIGDTYRIGEAIVQVSQPRQPCFKLGIRFDDQTIVGEFWNSAFPGVYIRILQAGNVKIGDRLTLIDQFPESLSISQIFSLFRFNRTNLDMMKKALQEPFLAESCRRDIKKIFDLSEN